MHSLMVLFRVNSMFKTTNRVLFIAKATVEMVPNIISSLEYSSEGILKELDTELFQEANRILQVDLKDYGVIEINKIDE